MSNSTLSRSFSFKDQQAFAALSGDANPLHVDPVLARRLLFGACAVHGIHLALWALDRLVAARPTSTGLGRVALSFDSAAIVGEAVTMEAPTEAGGELRVRLRSGNRPLARFRFLPGDPSPAWANPGPPPAEPCRAVDAAAIGTAAGEVCPGFDRVALARLFPALDGFAPTAVAWLLASTRIVGMRAPGLHSLFTGLDARFDGTIGGPLGYRTVDWDERFDLAVLALRGAGGEGQARALLRPPPTRQRSLAAIASDVDGARFAGVSALVIGGSRGLGEAAAKVFAAGGAAVTLTYRAGAEDAEGLVREIVGTGRRAEARRLDIDAPRDALTGAAFAPFTHVVFCAAPRIRKGGAVFDEAAFEHYRQAFADGLDRVLQAVEAQLAQSVTLIVPSTIYIERPEPGFAEYAAAKAASERVAADIASRWRAGGRQVTLLLPRFDRLATDQTAAPGKAAPSGSPAADPATAFLTIL